MSRWRIVFIGLLDPLAWLLVKVFPERKQSADPATPRYLDESALETPRSRWPMPRARRCAWATSSR